MPPNRKLVSTTLLDINYEYLQKTQLKNLLQQVDIYGLLLYGDGTTVHKMPLINILASGVFHPVAVFDIVNATEHLEKGGKKDATYIANLFQPHIGIFEEASPCSVDYLSFYGAGNVQLAGRILATRFPRIIVTHGAEHVISLFFTTVLNYHFFKQCTNLREKSTICLEAELDTVRMHCLSKTFEQFTIFTKA